MTWKIYLEQNQARFIEELVDFVSIPSVSAIDEHFDDVVKAGNWVVERLKAAGIANARLMQTETHPVVYGEFTGRQRSGKDSGQIGQVGSDQRIR